MKKLSNAILEITDEITIKEINDPLFEGLLDRLGISPGNIISGAKQLAGNFKVDPAGLANAAIALATNDQSLANTLTKRASDAIANLKSQNVMKAVKRMIDFQYAGSFKSKDDLTNSLDAYFKYVNIKSPQIKSGSGEIFDKFLALSFYFAASKNFSNVQSLSKDQIEVKDYVSEEGKIFSSNILPGSVQFTPLGMSKTKYEGNTGIDKKAAKYTNAENNSNKVTISSVTPSGGSISLSVVVHDAVDEDVSAKIKFYVIKETGEFSINDIINIEKLASNPVAIDKEFLRDLRNVAKTVSNQENHKILAYIEWMEGNDFLQSNYVEIPSDEFAESFLYKDVCTDIVNIIENSDLTGDLSSMYNSLLIPENIKSLPYFLASIGLCSSSSNDKTRSYLLDFTPIISTSSKLKEGMVPGVFKKSSEFNKNV